MNKYTKMQKEYYEHGADDMVKANHSQHNSNEDYWNVILGDIKKDPSSWKDLKALDFGCGCGRNILNLHSLADWASVDGCDISKNNIDYSRIFLNDNNIDADKSTLFVNDGTSLNNILSNYYDFVMSTIVFQHICVHEIRFNLLNELFRVLKPSGLLSLQMGFGSGHPCARDYYENYYDAKGTNSLCDVRVDNPSQLVDDLTKIGFREVNFEIRKSHADRHDEWIFVKATK